MKQFVVLLMTAAVLLVTGGCGYRVGTMGHPQIKTIAIAAVKNDTTIYNLSAITRNVLAEQFMLDGTLKVVSEKKADCILYARIIQATSVEVTESSSTADRTFEPEEWQIRVDVEYSVIIPGQKAPLIPLRKVTGKANFQAPGDMDSAMRRGAAQACRQAAVEMVEFTTEAW